MSVSEPHVSVRAAELRQAFDQSFIEAPRIATVATEDFLAIDVGGDPHTVRLAEVGGLYVDKKITGVPSRVAELRGLAGFRSVTMPVYDLAALLGYPLAETPRWLVVAADTPVAFAFERFEGHFRLPSQAIAFYEGDRARDHLRHIVRTRDSVRPVINMPSLVAAIRNRATPSGLRQEY